MRNKNMTYYIKTAKGTIKNKDESLMEFNSYSDARNWGINHLDLSSKGITIVSKLDIDELMASSEDLETKLVMLLEEEEKCL